MSSPGTAELDGLAGWTVDLMERLGGPGAGLAIFLENVFPPLPSEVILPMAGFAASLGRLSVVEAVLWTTLGSVVGAWFIYWLGARLGHDRMRRLVLKVPLIDVEDIDKSAAWFARHGTKGVFFGRMLPFFRSFISVPAGTERMNFAVFTVLTFLGSLIWNSVFVGRGRPRLARRLTHPSPAAGQGRHGGLSGAAGRPVGTPRADSAASRRRRAARVATPGR